MFTLHTVCLCVVINEQARLRAGLDAKCILFELWVMHRSVQVFEWGWCCDSAVSGSVLCFVTVLLFQFEGKKRISAEEAMRHSYFHCLGERVLTLPDSKRTRTHSWNRCEETERKSALPDRVWTHISTHIFSSAWRTYWPGSPICSSKGLQLISGA